MAESTTDAEVARLRRELAEANEVINRLNRMPLRVDEERRIRYVTDRDLMRALYYGTPDRAADAVARALPDLLGGLRDRLDDTQPGDASRAWLVWAPDGTLLNGARETLSRVEGVLAQLRTLADEAELGRHGAFTDAADMLDAALKGSGDA